MRKRLDVARHKQLIDEALPAQMMQLLILSMEGTGASVRSDVMVCLDRHLATVFNGLDEFSIKRLGRDVEKASHALLRETSGPDLRIGILVVCNLTMRLVEEGLKLDPASQDVLMAMLITEEAKEDGDWGAIGKAVSIEGGNLLRKAQLIGYFTPAFKLQLVSNG